MKRSYYSYSLSPAIEQLITEYKLNQKKQLEEIRKSKPRRNFIDLTCNEPLDKNKLPKQFIPPVEEPPPISYEKYPEPDANDLFYFPLPEFDPFDPIWCFD
jgi:hypothetical protein